MAAAYDLEGRKAEVIVEVAEFMFQLSTLPNTGRSGPTAFDSAAAPPITVRDYVHRLWQYMDCSIECFVIALSYIDRILLKHKDFRLGMLNIHTVTVSALVVAAKFHDDSFRSNAYYARVGGVSTQALYSLETQLIKLLDWQASVTDEDFSVCCELLFCEDRMNKLRARHYQSPIVDQRPKPQENTISKPDEAAPAKTEGSNEGSNKGLGPDVDEGAGAGSSTPKQSEAAPALDPEDADSPASSKSSTSLLASTAEGESSGNDEDAEEDEEDDEEHEECASDIADIGCGSREAAADVGNAQEEQCAKSALGGEEAQVSGCSPAAPRFVQTPRMVSSAGPTLVVQQGVQNRRAGHHARHGSGGSSAGAWLSAFAAGWLASSCARGVLGVAPRPPAPPPGSLSPLAAARPSNWKVRL
eukprot:gb/GFBE01060432.1/.p1 GENE.gb/GFBE01060432.1/~~gb/GFBE01060432.1/.p1  ORF type:complete len:415 (+),score=97.16 gb/GFBE01060432.1/:1-1245(+)